ncbi:MAG: restriction endonuclease [Burkholderiaceae bacterium]
MKLKMAENSLFAVLLRSPWWISVAVALAMLALARALLPPAYVPFGALGALPIAVIAVMSALRQWRAPNPVQIELTLQRVATLGRRELVAAIEVGLRRDGYAVLALDGQGAADLEAVKAGRTVLVACRRWKAASIGVEPLRALDAAVQARGDDAPVEGWMLGLGAASDAARAYAGEHRLRLVQGAELARLIGPPSGAHSKA